MSGSSRWRYPETGEASNGDGGVQGLTSRSSVGGAHQWARVVTATYAYSATTAGLTGMDYSDSTTDLTYTLQPAGSGSTPRRKG